MRDYRLIFGDCIERMAEIADGSVDLVVSDLPYEVTSCKWDVVIPLDSLWVHYRRLLKPSGAIVLTTCQPFTSMMVMSNPEWFRFEIIWDKVVSTGFMHANKRPLRRHENILVFSPGRVTYNPKMTEGEPYRFARKPRIAKVLCEKRANITEWTTVNHGTRYPTSIISISNAKCKNQENLHPTQKPVPLFDYLIRSYSNPGDLVLDNAMGSGTTIISAVDADRRAIGIENDPEMFAIAEKRIANHVNSTPLFP
jgi:DNA modification methylase